MASMFGFIKSLFGGPVKQQKTSHSDDDGNKPASHEQSADAAFEGSGAVVDKVSEDAASDVIHEAEADVIAAAAAIGGVSGSETDAITTAAVTAFADEEGDTPALPALALTKDVVYLDRDHFQLPQSEIIGRALDFVNSETNGAASGRGKRIYDYGVAAAEAYELRVYKELLALAAIFNELSDFAASKAESFLIENNMWKSLAAKVAAAIQHQEDGLTSNDVETRVLALGVQAEDAHGEIEYVHPATAAETRARH